MLKIAQLKWIISDISKAFYELKLYSGIIPPQLLNKCEIDCKSCSFPVFLEH